jgi:hypothetical protein
MTNKLLRNIYQLINVDMSKENIRKITSIQDTINEKRIQLNMHPLHFDLVERVNIPSNAESLTECELETIEFNLINEYNEWTVLQSKMNTHCLKCIFAKLVM